MKATIICNPVAGTRSCADDVQLAAGVLAAQGWEIVAVEETRGGSDATTFARKAAAEGCDAVFVAGGDGTIAEAVDGLVNTETVLGVLPGGTGNVFARQLGLPVPGGLHPRPITESMRLLLAGQVRRVDVGRITPRGAETPARHFICWGSVGFDAQVNRTVNASPERKKQLGPGATVVTTFLTLRDFAGTSAVVRIDGHRVSRRMMMLVANNIQHYGIVFRMAQNAVIDDGLLDIYCFQGSGPFRTLAHIGNVLISQHIQDPRVDIYRARRVEIRTYRPLPVQVDGDYIGNTPIVIEVVPRAIDLMVPPSAPASLFTDGTGLLARETAWAWMIRRAREVQIAFKARSGNP
jgi:YegS/Rv2252/BmrU family lipid kinase